jgi:endonuclease YncB( thermonuclease family)
MPTLAGRVTDVTDGDTVTVRFENGAVETVRLWGIDAPEKGQPYGTAATQAARQLAGGEPVRVEAQKRGPYGRIIGRVETETGDVGASLVHHGYAWADRKNGHSGRLSSLEKRARQDGKGLWAQDSPVPPWHYRGSGATPRQKLRALAIAGAAGVGVLLFVILLVLLAL